MDSWRELGGLKKCVQLEDKYRPAILCANVCIMLVMCRAFLFPKQFHSFFQFLWPLKFFSPLTSFSFSCCCDSQGWIPLPVTTCTGRFPFGLPSGGPLGMVAISRSPFWSLAPVLSLCCGTPAAVQDWQCGAQLCSNYQNPLLPPSTDQTTWVSPVWTQRLDQLSVHTSTDPRSGHGQDSTSSATSPAKQ